MSECEKKSGGAGCFIWGVGTFIFLVLYVLSVGPAAWLAGSFPAMEGLKILYIPLLVSGSVFRPWGNALEWYLDFWQ